MKYELKDYQEDAAREVLRGLRRGSRDFTEDSDYAAVSLSAPTGAGKTVIASAVIERILFGDEDGDVPGDPNAVIVWLTDDPALNAQTSKKILAASERVQPTMLVPLDDEFDAPELSRGVVYFVNIQKLAKTSNLVIKKEGRRNHSIWETFSKTIENNGAHYYLIIDEAHKGTGGSRGRSVSEEQTIAQRLVHGEPGQVLAAPVVLGISATPERFEQSIKDGRRPRVLRSVAVPVELVRESGLIKDVLSLRVRGKEQAMETTLVRRAVRDLVDFDREWGDYTDKEGEPPVRPAMVLQLPANVNSEHVGGLLDVAVEEWPELAKPGAIAHSLESHVAETFGKHTANYVAPQAVQDHPHVRLVLFKEALTTGWDCPRAEVMVSLRTAQDTTYIAQLIGRMVRAPLARRIESIAALNLVAMYLPHFNSKAVQGVVDHLEGNDGGLPIEVEIEAVLAPRNENLPSEVFGLVESLPTYVVPGPVHRSQVVRLNKLAALLVGDKLLPDALRAAREFLVSVLDDERARLAADGRLAALVRDTETSTVEILDVAHEGTTRSVRDYDTDYADIERLLGRARSKFRDGLADQYWGHRVTNGGDDPYDAKVLTIALSREGSVADRLEKEASGRVRQWLDTYGDRISRLSDDQKAKYTSIEAMAREPEPGQLSLPRRPITMTGDEEVETYTGHLYADKGGVFRFKAGSWEKHVLAVEIAHPDFVAWYRNPTGGQRSLRLSYKTQDDAWGKLYPDFVVAHRDGNGVLAPSIIDPHGHHLSDAGEKLRGLGAYAEKHGDAYARIIAVIRTAAGEFRFIDLKKESVRKALSAANGQDVIEQVYLDHGAVYG